MMETSLLAGWDNFLVIAGSSSAGLTGLTFIVITLAAQSGRVNANGLRVFITPTIVHFSVVLAFSALLSVPHHTPLSLCLSFTALGMLGLAYIATIAAGIRGIASTYVPVHEDWIWNVIIPGAAYGVCLAAGALVWRAPHASLFTVGGVLLVLMLIGIHNAWDIAVWNSTRQGTKESKPADE